MLFDVMRTLVIFFSAAILAVVLMYLVIIFFIAGLVGGVRWLLLNICF